MRKLVLAGALAAFTPEMEDEANRFIASKVDAPWHAAAAEAIEREDRGDYSSHEESAELWNLIAPLYFSSWEERYRPYVTFERLEPEPLRAFSTTPFDLRPDLGRIDAPTLAITGRDDFICGPAAAEVLVDGITDAELVLVDRAGHMAFLEQPDAFRAAVEEFLSR